MLHDLPPAIHRAAAAPATAAPAAHAGYQPAAHAEYQIADSLDAAVLGAERARRYAAADAFADAFTDAFTGEASSAQAPRQP